MDPVKLTIIQAVIGIVATAATTAITIAGTLALRWLGKTKKAEHSALALDLLIQAAQTTVKELHQTTVEKLKEDSADGKLTKEEIAALNQTLLCEAKKKLAPATIETLTAAAYDIDNIILGYGEALIADMHTEQPVALQPVVDFLNEPFVEEPVAPEG